MEAFKAWELNGRFEIQVLQRLLHSGPIVVLSKNQFRWGKSEIQQNYT